MNLSYTEEQVMLREQIQKFCETEYDFYKREEVVKSDNDFDEKHGLYLLNKDGYQCHFQRSLVVLVSAQLSYQSYLKNLVKRLLLNHI